MHLPRVFALLVLTAAVCAGALGTKGGAIGGTAARAAAVRPADGTEAEVSFTSGGDTIFGTLELPVGATGPVPGAVIIAGSGPTDRDGNSAILPGPTNTLRDFAGALAADSVASLRYDKVGTGETGIASHTGGAGIAFNTFVDEALAAYRYLRGRPEVDPSRMLILGHSEGGLIALVVAASLNGTDEQLQALVLAAPLSVPYLQTLRRQEVAAVTLQAQSGQITQQQADDFVAELDRVIAAIEQTGVLPPDGVHIRSLAALFSPLNATFLAQANQYDPGALAASLPASLPALVLHGEKDEQVEPAEVDHLMAGFQQAGNTSAVRYELANVDHVFKEVPGTPNAALDYINPDLPFSTVAVRLLASFIADTLGWGVSQ